MLSAAKLLGKGLKYSPRRTQGSAFRTMTTQYMGTALTKDDKRKYQEAHRTAQGIIYDGSQACLIKIGALNTPNPSKKSYAGVTLSLARKAINNAREQHNPTDRKKVCKELARHLFMNDGKACDPLIAHLETKYRRRKFDEMYNQEFGIRQR